MAIIWQSSDSKVELQSTNAATDASSPWANKVTFTPGEAGGFLNEKQWVFSWGFSPGFSQEFMMFLFDFLYKNPWNPCSFLQHLLNFTLKSLQPLLWGFNHCNPMFLRAWCWWSCLLRPAGCTKKRVKPFSPAKSHLSKLALSKHWGLEQNKAGRVDGHFWMSCRLEPAKSKKCHFSWVTFSLTLLSSITGMTYTKKPSAHDFLLLMSEILHQLIGSYPTIYRILYIPGGAAFLPSTVCLH